MSDDPDRIFQITCPCCNKTRAISAHNIKRIIRAAALRNPQSGSGELDLTRIPEDLDMTMPQSAETIARIAALALKVDPASDGAGNRSTATLHEENE